MALAGPGPTGEPPQCDQNPLDPLHRLPHLWRPGHVGHRPPHRGSTLSPGSPPRVGRRHLDRGGPACWHRRPPTWLSGGRRTADRRSPAGGGPGAPGGAGGRLTSTPTGHGGSVRSLSGWRPPSRGRQFRLGSRSILNPHRLGRARAQRVPLLAWSHARGARPASHLGAGRSPSATTYAAVRDAPRPSLARRVSSAVSRYPRMRLRCVAMTVSTACWVTGNDSLSTRERTTSG